MKKIYVFYLYIQKDEMTVENYPGINGLEIIKGDTFYHVLYGWTPNKLIRKRFKQQRDMSKFKEVIHEIDDDEFDKFSDQYSDTFLEERGITTKSIDEFDTFVKQTVCILTTNKELEIMIENDYNNSFMRSQLEPVIITNISIKEKYFSDKYRRALKFFKFDDIISAIFPFDENDEPPFNLITNDNLAIYTHLYYNTYRKEIGSL